jgi:hypothetical protein
MFRFSLFNRRFGRLSLLVMLALALVLTALPSVAMAAPAASHDSKESCGGCYIVKKGDTLSHIAKWYGINYFELARFNGITNPSVIYIGQVIRIPYGHSCGGCNGSYDSESGYLHGYHSETTIIVDEVYYGYEYSGEDYDKK